MTLKPIFHEVCRWSHRVPDAHYFNLEKKSETQTRRELSWGEAMWGATNQQTDRQTDRQTDQPTDEESDRGAMLVPKKPQQ